MPLGKVVGGSVGWGFPFVCVGRGGWRAKNIFWSGLGEIRKVQPSDEANDWAFLDPGLHYKHIHTFG